MGHARKYVVPRVSSGFPRSRWISHLVSPSNTHSHYTRGRSAVTTIDDQGRYAMGGRLVGYRTAGPEAIVTSTAVISRTSIQSATACGSSDVVSRSISYRLFELLCAHHSCSKISPVSCASSLVSIWAYIREVVRGSACRSAR